MTDRPADLNDARPTSVRHLIGQPSVIEQVVVALDSAHQDSRKFDHALLVGPPGCGKTQTAKVIAAEMGTEFIEVLGQSVNGIGEMNSLLLQPTERAICLIDEAHELDKSLQTALYLALDQRKVLLQGTRRGSAPVGVPTTDFTVLLATTDEYQLMQPLRDRMRLMLRFSFYDHGDLAEIARLRATALGWRVEEEVFPHVAARSRGTPRLALRLLQAAHRVARAGGEGVVSMAHLHRACALEGIDDLGLGPTERAYLRVLEEGPTRLNMLASRLGLPARTVSEVTEPYLVRAGLVEKDELSRRQLTAAGRVHCSSVGV